MYAMFVAHGPFAAVAKAVQQSRSVGTPKIVSRVLFGSGKGWHLTSNDTYIMEGFGNVEIYNLVIKLLGAERWAANTNGTTGLWDKYF